MDPVKIDFSKVEKQIIACGVLPKGLSKNAAFLTMYGRNPQTVFNNIQFNIQGILTGRFSANAVPKIKSYFRRYH